MPNTAGGLEKETLTTKADNLYRQKEEEQKQNNKLSRDKVDLIGQIATLEQSLKSDILKNAAQLRTFTQRSEQLRAAKTEEAGRMAQRRREIEQQLGSTSVVQAEVERLRDAMQTLQDVAAAEKASNAQKEEEVKKHAFAVRKQLEELSRKTLRELTKEFEERAAKAMENESKNALQQNALLQEELAEHSAMVLRLMDEHQKKYDDLRAIRMERDLLKSQTSIQAQRVESLTENKVEYEEIIAETQAQIAEIHAENRNLSEHEEMITHTVDKIARLEDERERLLMDIGKAKARALHLTRVVLAARQSYVRHTQQQQASGRSNENSHTLINIGALQNGEQAKQYPPAAPSPRITNRNKIPKGTAEELAIWSTAHFSNADISW